MKNIILALIIALATLPGCRSRPKPPPVVTPPPAPPPSPQPVFYDLDVRVRDDRNAGVVSTVSLLENGDTRMTDGSGFANFGVAPGAYTIGVAATGFHPLTVTVEVAGNLPVDVTLVRERPRQVRGRLQARGRALTYPDGSPFQWRFVTGFQLLEQVAHGRQGDAVAFLKWARHTGFNGVRVLTMASGLFRLPPSEGLAALSAFLAMADAEDLYVELVALADTRAYTMSDADMRTHVQAVAAVAAQYDVALVQVANENRHPTQQGSLGDVGVLRGFTSTIPPGVLFTEAPGDDDEAHEPQGRFATRHLDRGRDMWNQVRRVRELEVLSAAIGRPVVNDEPIGADELDGRQTGRQRFNEPAAFFTLGVLGRIFEVGTTFHFQNGLFAQLPGPVQQRCVDAFIQGATLWPDDVRLTFKNANWADSPVQGAAFAEPGPGTVVRVYSGVSGNRGYTVALGLTGDPGIRWGNGWSIVRELARWPGVIVWEIGR